MARTNIDIDEDACARVMHRYGLHSKKDAVNFALRELAVALTEDQARSLKGSGWDGDLNELRGTRAVPS